MKSILLATLEYPPFKGGIANYLSNVVACFPKGAVHVLAPEDDAAHDVDMKSDAPIFRKPLLAKWLRPRWLAAWYWTSWVVRREKPDVLMVSHLLPMGLVARKLHKRRGLPYVVIVHGMDVALALEGGRKRAQAKDILANAMLVVANSTYTANLAESAGAPKQRIAVLRPSPGFALDTFVPADRLSAVKQFYQWPEGYTLLAVGRQVERKGFGEAIEAVAELKERGRTVSLVLAGDGPDRPRLEELAKKLGVEGRVRFLGKVPDADLPGLYAACDVFVTASKTLGPDVEGFGIVYLEANLMGKPVIASRVGGVVDAVVHEKTGLLLDASSGPAIADAVQRLMNDPALAARLGSEGQKRVKEEFGWQRQSHGLVSELMKE